MSSSNSTLDAHNFPVYHTPMATLTVCASCETPVGDPSELVKCEECGDLVCEACIVRSEDEETGAKTVLCEDCDINVYGSEDEDEELEDDLDDEDEDSDDDEELEIGVDDEDEG